MWVLTIVIVAVVVVCVGTTAAQDWIVVFPEKNQLIPRCTGDVDHAYLLGTDQCQPGEYYRFEAWQNTLYQTVACLPLGAEVELLVGDDKCVAENTVTTFRATRDQGVFGEAWFDTVAYWTLYVSEEACAEVSADGYTFNQTVLAQPPLFISSQPSDVLPLINSIDDFVIRNFRVTLCALEANLTDCDVLWSVDRGAQPQLQRKLQFGECVNMNENTTVSTPLYGRFDPYQAEWFTTPPPVASGAASLRDRQRESYRFLSSLWAGLAFLKLLECAVLWPMAN